jgi:carbon storage regulator CsrA
MLILARKLGQRIRINETTELTILHVKGNRVTIGITAPADVRIRRLGIIDFDDSPAKSPANLTDRPAGTYDDGETLSIEGT